MKIDLSNITPEELLLFNNLEESIIKLIPLKSNLRLYHLAFLIDYPPNKTSELIKKIYGNRLDVVINHYRLKYFEELMNKELYGENKVVKIHLIKKAGFNSRNTFYCAVKRKNELL
jgi:hypothetical protein